MNKKLFERIIEETNDLDTNVKTKYFRLSSNRKIIETNLRNIEKYCKIDFEKKFIDSVLEKSKNYNAIGIFAKKSQQPLVDYSHFEYECEFNYKNYFILPFFDIRREILEKLAVLKFSLNKVDLLRYKDGKLVKVKLENSDNFIKQYENDNQLVRDNSQPLKEHVDSLNSEEYLDGDLSTLIKEIESKARKMKVKILIASDDPNIHILTNHINENLLLSSHLSGNYDKKEGGKLLKTVQDHIESYTKIHTNQLEKKLNISESNQLQNKSFVDILSAIKGNRISDMYIGNLDLNDKTEDRPIAPLGANYIALEVLKYGGNVEYYPGSDFDFSNNNIVFGFRY